jgi:catechol 2,3-dioxygenase-like lactoylglutathione lyase family enzyme
MTDPAQPASAAAVSIALDVADLARSSEFYRRVLDLEVVEKRRRGLPFESWVLRGPRYPALALVIRQSYRRPVIGSVPGGITCVGLRDPSLAEIAARLEGKTPLVEPDCQSPPGECLQFYDPDGYLIRLTP